MDSPIQSTGTEIIQNINYSGLESEFSAKIVGQNVTVHCSSGQHTHGSSKVKLINRIDYNWEFHYYRGQLVAVHINGKIVAYGMKGKDGGMVRVTNQETGDRALIKNLRNDVKDVAFAFSKTDIILGCIDDEGNVRIYEIIDKPGSITYNLLLHIYHSDILPHAASNFRIIWCPYLSWFGEDEVDNCDDPEKMFVILNNNKAEIWNYGIINNKYSNGIVEPNPKYEGYVEITHNAELVDASFSSDGTAIAIACLDGYVKFFQIYMVDNDKQKCLHEWRPHGGSPLSSIIFVDNLLECSSQCWKFTITGANHNSELKLWSCETWTCLQTIHFKPDPTNLIQNVYLKISIDYTGQYLIMSDLNNKVLYVLQLERNDDAQKISVVMLSQFLLPTPFLSFHITEATVRKLRTTDLSTSDDFVNDLDEHDLDDDDDDDIDTLTTACIIKLLVIQQKKFQECNIVFQPETLLYSTEIIHKQIQQKHDGGGGDGGGDDDEEEMNCEKVPKLDDLQSSVTLLIHQQQQVEQQQQQESLNLMTPEAFTTNPTTTTTEENSNDLNKKLHENVDNVENLIDFQRPEKDNFASGGSSPSREVQEILSLNNSTYTSQDYFDNLTKMDDDDDDDDNHEDPPLKDNTITTSSATMSVATTTTTTTSTVGTSTTATTAWLKMPLVNDNKQEINGDNNEVVDNSNDWIHGQIQSINLRLTTLQSTINDQNLMLQKLHQELKNLNQIKTTVTTTPAPAVAATTTQTTNQNILISDEFNKELELAMSKQHLQIAKMLENLLNMQKNNERQQHEQIITNLSQILTQQINEKIQNIIGHEMKHVVVPTIRNLVEALKHQLDLQNTQKLNSDIALQEKITKLVNSKALAESLSMSVANVIAPILEKCYKDMVATTLIPSLERICGNMFHQINETFTQGTKEYTASVESYMERQKRVQERGKDLVSQIQTVADNLQKNTEKFTNTFTTDVHKQFNNTIKHMQENLIQNIKDVISEQIKLGFKNHASVLEDSVINAVRSRAVTPSIHTDTQVTLTHLDHLIAKECYDEAFQVALSAENLNFVIYVCEKVDIHQVFHGNMKLPQNCILALIQQLSMELNKNTETKLSYIRAALVALIPNYTQTRQFIPKVMGDLLKQLQIFMSSNPSSKHITDAKLLKMAVDSILDK